MAEDNYDIEQIEAFLSGEMSSEEQLAFQERIDADEALQTEVQAYKDVLAATNQAGRLGMKKELAALGAGMLAAGELDAYTPSSPESKEPPKKKGSTIKSIFSLLVLAGIGYAVYHFYQTGQLQEWLNIEQNIPEGIENRTDTIYLNQPPEEILPEVIEFDTIVRNDTIIYYEDAAIELLIDPQIQETDTGWSHTLDAANNAQPTVQYNADNKKISSFSNSVEGPVNTPKVIRTEIISDTIYVPRK